jgi:hypothetical protein
MAVEGIKRVYVRKVEGEAPEDPWKVIETHYYGPQLSNRQMIWRAVRRPKKLYEVLQAVSSSLHPLRDKEQTHVILIPDTLQPKAAP